MNKRKEEMMEYFRVSRMCLVIASFCILGMTLTGCGKKETPETTSTAPAESSATTVKRTFKTAEPAEQKETPVPSTAPITEERTYYDFETDLEGWEIPMWAEGKSDHVASNPVVSEDVASKGHSSMKIDADFTGGSWTAALVEIQQYLNMSAYRVVSADIYLPPDAPQGLKAKIILTVGDTWKFVEMSQSIALIPGEWVTVTANIEPGSYDWKRVVPDEEFAEDVRKIAIRIVSNRKPQYTGPIYIDNIRVGR